MQEWRKEEKGRKEREQRHRPTPIPCADCSRCCILLSSAPWPLAPGVTFHIHTAARAPWWTRAVFAAPFLSPASCLETQAREGRGNVVAPCGLFGDKMVWSHPWIPGKSWPESFEFMNGKNKSKEKAIIGEKLEKRVDGRKGTES